MKRNRYNYNERAKNENKTRGRRLYGFTHKYDKIGLANKWLKRASERILSPQLIEEGKSKLYIFMFFVGKKEGQPSNWREHLNIARWFKMLVKWSNIFKRKQRKINWRPPPPLRGFNKEKFNINRDTVFK